VTVARGVLFAFVTAGAPPREWRGTRTPFDYPWMKIGRKLPTRGDR